jgi:hypothetical protein
MHFAIVVAIADMRQMRMVLWFGHLGWYLCALRRLFYAP